MSQHPIVHIEFPSKDPGAAAKFYSDLFGWKTTAMQGFNYQVFEAEGGPGGGFAELGGPVNNKVGEIFVYIQTNDIEADLAKAEKLGGKALLPRTEIPGQGWFALFADPTGNRVALYTGPQNPGS